MHKQEVAKKCLGQLSSMQMVKNEKCNIRRWSKELVLGPPLPHKHTEGQAVVAVLT